MTPMHPHWQSTDDEQEVPVRAKNAAPERQRQQQSPIRVSRAPAAVVGILLMLGVAAYSFGGLGEIIGQLTNPTPDVTIHLTQDGPDPTPATVRPGQVIRFVNDDQIPHVLSSDTLPTADGTTFSTPGIFSNGDYFYAVPASAQAGTHTYISETSPDLSGEIIIETAVVASSASSVALVVSSASSAAALPTSSVPQLPLSSAPIFPPLGTTSSVASTSTLPAGVIAVNPYVVGRTGTTTSRKPGVTQHKPTGNTESGPAVWIAIACSAVALYLATKGAFKRV